MCVCMYVCIVAPVRNFNIHLQAAPEHLTKPFAPRGQEFEPKGGGGPGIWTNNEIISWFCLEYIKLLSEEFHFSINHTV